MNAIWFSGVKAGRKINPESNCWYVPNVPPHPYLPFSVPPADRPPLMAVTPGVEDGRVYFICSGPIGGLFVFLQTSVGRSGTIPVFFPLSVKAAHIPWVSFARFCVKVMLTCSDGVEYSSIFDTDINNDKRFKSNTVNPRKYSDPNIFAEVLSCKMKAEFFYLCLLFFLFTPAKYLAWHRLHVECAQWPSRTLFIYSALHYCFCLHTCVCNSGIGPLGRRTTHVENVNLQCKLIPLSQIK